MTVSMLFANGTQTGVIYLDVSGNTYVDAQAHTADLMGVSFIGSNSNFNTSSDWRCVVIEYINRAAGQVYTMRLSPPLTDDLWQTSFYVDSGMAIGNYVIHSVMILKESMSLILDANFFNTGTVFSVAAVTPP